MSPRSEEYMAQARHRLATLRKLSPAEEPHECVSLAYYAMLYAARAALSEQDTFARTHRGTWQLVHEQLVTPGRLDAALLTAAHQALVLREGGDYRAVEVSAADAERVVADANAFVAAIEALLG